MLDENNGHETTSKLGAYGNVIVDDKTLINTELSYMEDNRSMASYNKSSFKPEKQTSNISMINRNPMTNGAYSSMNQENPTNKYQGKNPEYYYEDEIILEENENEQHNENLIVNEVKNNFIEKVQKINNDFLIVSNNAKKNNDYFQDKYNIPKNVNDEFLNSSNLIKIMSNNKSGKMPPKLFRGLNNSQINTTNNKSLESNFIDEVNNKTGFDTSKTNFDNDAFENYFNIVPDNSMINISTFTNSIKVKENNQSLKNKDLSWNNDNVKNYNISNTSKFPINIFAESGKFDFDSSKNIHKNNNSNDFSVYYTLKGNNNFDIRHDSVIPEFDNTILESSIIISNNNHEDNKLSFEIPKAEEKEPSVISKEDPIEPLKDISLHEKGESKYSKDEEPEIVMVMSEEKVQEPKKASESKYSKDEEPEIVLVMSEEKVQEPKKASESFFEETFYEEAKEKYHLFKPLETEENINLHSTSSASTSFKKDKNSLMDIFGRNLIQNWAKTAKPKLDIIKQGIKEDKFFTKAFFEQEPLIDFKNKAASRNFIKGLDAYKDSIKHIFESCEGKDFFEINDLFKIQIVPDCEFKLVEGKNVIVEPKFNWGSNAKYIEEKKALLETLSGRVKKTTFNKVSFLYDKEVLKQKYTICDENLDFGEEAKEGIFGSKKDLENILNNNLDRQNNNLLDEITDVQNIEGADKLIFEINNNDEDEKICLFRESVCDGNSFYRMFIFAYFESLIISKNLDLLAKVFIHIFKVYQNLYLINESKKLDNEKYIFNKINLQVVLITFNFIINFMRIGDCASAYKIMLNAFNLEDGSFDKIVIGYLRLNVLDYINYIERTESELLKKDPKTTIVKKKLFRNFTFSYIEPEEIILELIAKMYNVNLNLLYVDGSINKEDQKKFSLGKKTYYAGEETKNLPSINLFYNLNCFFKFYTIREYKENINVFKGFVSKIKEIIFADSEFTCELCKKEEKNNKKIFFRSQLICACIECIRVKADSIIYSRFFNYQQDIFLSREFYCKPLNIQKQITIDDYLYIQLFGKNIWNELMQRINNNCSKCNKKSEKLYETKTNLNYCKECLLDLINKFTDNFIILNDFEKKQMIKKYPDLPTICELDESIDLLGLRTEEKALAAEKRLKYTYETLCCDCIENKKTSPNQQNENSFVKFYKLDISDNNSKQIEINNNNTNAITQCIHLICANCVEKHKCELESKKATENDLSNFNNKSDNVKSVNNKNKRNLINKANNKLIEFEFLCNICDKKHLTNVKVDENSRNNKNACCAGCLIF